jgi:hypothetical protein
MALTTQIRVPNAKAMLMLFAGLVMVAFIGYSAYVTGVVNATGQPLHQVTGTNPDGSVKAHQDPALVADVAPEPTKTAPKVTTPEPTVQAPTVIVVPAPDVKVDVTVPQSSVQPTAPSTRIEEDTDGWDCTTMGNMICGVDINGQHVLISYANGMPVVIDVQPSK